MAQTPGYRDPDWWQEDYSSGWERVKEAFRRDWEQTKRDFGAGGRDFDQDVDDTVAQATGARPIPPRNQPNVEADFDEYEPAYRFGYGARRRYGSTYSEWGEDLESRLREDWQRTRTGAGDDWDRYRENVRRGFEFNP